MRGPSKFVWRGLQFVRGQHPRGLKKTCWFHDPLKLAVVETRPGNFTAYARFDDIYERDHNTSPADDLGATVWSAEHSFIDKYSPDQHSSLDALLRQLQIEERGPWTVEKLRSRVAELIFEIEQGPL